MDKTEEIQKLCDMIAQMRGTVMEHTSVYWRLQSQLAELQGGRR